jgi:hypothetical protein
MCYNYRKLRLILLVVFGLSSLASLAADRETQSLGEEESQIWAWSIHWSTFTKEGAQCISEKLGQKALYPLFKEKSGKFYITEQALDLGDKIGLFEEFGFAEDLGAGEDHWQTKPKMAEVPAFEALLGGLGKNLQDLLTHPPRKLLRYGGITALYKKAQRELDLAENQLSFFALCADHSNSSELKEIIENIAYGDKKFIFCTDGTHTNLISSRSIKDKQYFFIIDSIGENNETKKNPNINRKLINKQIEVLTLLKKLTIINGETRQKDNSSCPAFAYMDLKDMHNQPELHEDFLRDIFQSSDNENLCIFPQFPAQMLVMLQASSKAIFEENRMNEMINFGENTQCTLKEVLEKNSKAGRNMYAQDFIKRFIDETEGW